MKRYMIKIPRHQFRNKDEIVNLIIFKTLKVALLNKTLK